MKFTRRTYRAAIRRAFNMEYTLFAEHTRAFSGPARWIKQMHLTNALKLRKIREGK
jgi:hypothetical protein